MKFDDRLDPALLSDHGIARDRSRAQHPEAALPHRAVRGAAAGFAASDPRGHGDRSPRRPGRPATPTSACARTSPTVAAPASAAMFWIHGGGMVIGTHRRRRLHVQDVGTRLRVPGRVGRLPPRPGAPASSARRRLLRRACTGSHTRLDDSRRRSFTHRDRWRERRRRARCRHRAPARDRRRSAAVLPVPRVPDDRRPRPDRVDARDHDPEGLEPTIEPDRLALDISATASPAPTSRSTPRRRRATVDDLRGLPPAYIDVGELDPFRDEDVGYAMRLVEAGVRVRAAPHPRRLPRLRDGSARRAELTAHPRLPPRRARSRQRSS